MKNLGFMIGVSLSFWAVAYFTTRYAIDIAGMPLGVALIVGLCSGTLAMLFALGLGAWSLIGTPERQARSFKKFLERSGNDLQRRKGATTVKGTQAGEETPGKE